MKKIETITSIETKEKDNCGIKDFETTTTIYVKPVKVKTHYCFATKKNTN